MGKWFYSILQTSWALCFLLNQLTLGLWQEYADIWFLCLNHRDAGENFLLSTQLSFFFW